MVSLEDLSTRFKISNKEVVQRIKDLEAQARLTGVIDDRGKYIYLTVKELDGILNLIRSQGKITRADLVTECSRIVNMEPSAEARAKIEREEEEFKQQLNSQLAKELGKDE